MTAPDRCDADPHPVTDLPCTRPSHTGVHTVDGDTWDTPDNEETP